MDAESLMNILDSMEDRIYVVGRDYRIRFLNASLRREMGDGRGVLCYEFFGHDPAQCQECQHGMSSFEPERRREWTSPANGRVYEVSVSPLHGPDGSISRLHIMRDITERKALERKLQEQSRSLADTVRRQAQELFRKERLSLLGEIAAGLAHELRTPLGAILTGIKLLEREPTDPDRKVMLFELMKKETTRLERKLSEFLEYARGRLPERRPTPVGALLEEVRAVLEADADRVGAARIQVRVADDVGEFPLDRDQFKQVLLNLGQNALQALKGSGTLELEARRTAHHLEILVRDDGPGIASQHLGDLFKPFFSTRPEGTGLGLAVCKDIVEAHGGRISVSSLPQVQTTFRILLPDEPFQNGILRP
ncbi:Signal transduction histidine kinase, nitrogen specific [Desulfacinum hydrothermale DSM 13146]|uniref:histidine kinase n=1 Tax=Desulfacinum hydrothermale DSM 13146 TaxID=1121390 RepID=A0A1W1XP94_9BACT|nr:ATP-binding protein [Desulfacinum hydrothermale]SMC25338.1 Signal transduction histidine kinase, nitrogen specific [Desulfacinum hydrothermale DSM 13146]